MPHRNRDSSSQSSICEVSDSSSVKCCVSLKSDSTSCDTSCDSSSEFTYTSCSSKDSCSSSSLTSSCCKPKCEDNCSQVSKNKCSKLVKKYACAKETLMANNDMTILLEFIKNKLIAVQPLIDARNMCTYSVHQNVVWMENFIDTLFCVLRKNKAYKTIQVKECKVSNNCEMLSDRTYLIKLKYNDGCKEINRTIPLTFYWTRITYNDSRSFIATLKYTHTEIDNELATLRAQSTVPFINN